MGPLRDRHSLASPRASRNHIIGSDADPPWACPGIGPVWRDRHGLFALYPHRGIRINLLISLVALAASGLAGEVLQAANLPDHLVEILGMLAGGFIAAWLGASFLSRIPKTRIMGTISLLCAMLVWIGVWWVSSGHTTRVWDAAQMCGPYDKGRAPCASCPGSRRTRGSSRRSAAADRPHGAGDARLMVDAAHSLGVLKARGHGSAEHFARERHLRDGISSTRSIKTARSQASCRHAAYPMCRHGRGRASSARSMDARILA